MVVLLGFLGHCDVRRLCRAGDLPHLVATYNKFMTRRIFEVLKRGGGVSTQHRRGRALLPILSKDNNHDLARRDTMTGKIFRNTARRSNTASMPFPVRC